MWPDGTYALPASMFGCPETEDRGWSLSFVNLTLPDSADKQEWNMKDPRLKNNIIEPNILGPYYYRALQMNFCVKEEIYVEEEDNRASIEWPRGQYCIFGFNNSCPEGTCILKKYAFTSKSIVAIVHKYKLIDCIVFYVVSAIFQRAKIKAGSRNE